MYLKSLTLKGFKSFADRTHMVFDPGLTVVVGPNGSGKSNVSDAILWVLGEQSAKMLRGSAMEDVIFSGSSARQAVGVAEVTLVLDNSDHVVPVDFSELGITRRMYRSGESEYLINGSPARLMDIQDLLHDSGLGKDTHSIISQGKLDHILSSRPEERRVLIEEAASISKHRRRKERSERKLKSMDEKLLRAKDIARVINRQLKPLERQVDKAQRAAALTERLNVATTTLAVDDLRSLQLSWQRLTTKANELDAELELAQYRLAEKKKELNNLQVMLEQKGLFVGDLSEQRRRIQDMVGRINSDMRLLEEKGKNMVDKLSEMRASKSQIENQINQASAELERCDVDCVEATKLVELLTQKTQELGPQAAEAREVRSEHETAMQRIASMLRASQKEADKLSLEYARLKEMISNAEVEDALFKNRIAAIQETCDMCEDALRERAEVKTQLESELEDAEASLEQATRKLDDIRINMSVVQSQQDDALKEFTHTKAQLEALLSVDESQKDTSPLVGLLCRKADIKTHLKGRLSDYLDIKGELEPLIEKLLGGDLEALVSSEEGLVQIAETALGNTQKGRATALALPGNSLNSLSQIEPPCGKRLTTFFATTDKSKALIESLFGSYVLVDTFAEAWHGHEINPSFTYILPSGSRVLPDGRCIFGDDGNTQKGALERKRRIKELSKLVPRLQESLDDLNDRFDDLKRSYKVAQEVQERARGDLARLKGSLTSVTSELGRLDVELSASKRELSEVIQKRHETAQKAQTAHDELASKKLSIDDLVQDIDDYQIQLEDLQVKHTSALENEKHISALLSEARLELATVSERKRHQESRLGDLKIRLKDLIEKQQAIDESARALEIVRLRVNPLHDTYSAIQEAAWIWARRLQDRASLAEADSDSLKKTIGEARRAVAAAHGEVDRIQVSINESKVESGKLEVQVEQAIQRIVSLGAYTLEEALELESPEDREALEREVSKLQRQIEDIGPVNQVAMEEYSKLKERADYIFEQVDDLESAKKSLMKITAAIERKMKRQFLLTFEEVNHNFEEIFSLLFPGGKAHLEMLDPDRPSETGIEIVAQPKGKKITKMMLMSGGEKSLTALALLFAVYKTRTVPFYVFDEVEAALDAANLDKLLYAIERLKETTQLIVISHQRKTMEQADVLYGVSMQADGVSHVVSQRLDRSTGKVVNA